MKRTLGMPSKVVALLRQRIVVASAAVAVILATGTYALVHAATSGANVQLKGVGTWKFTGVNHALAESGASWYYNWGPSPDGMHVPSRMRFVPMICRKMPSSGT